MDCSNTIAPVDLSNTDTISKFSPKGINLSDAWVVKIIKSDLASQLRIDFWPAIFNAKYIHRKYVNKGKASKICQDGSWKYDIVFGVFQMHGEEGHAFSRRLNPLMQYLGMGGSLKPQRQPYSHKRSD